MLEQKDNGKSQRSDLVKVCINFSTVESVSNFTFDRMAKGDIQASELKRANTTPLNSSPGKISKSSKTVPLLVVIVVPFVLQIFAAVGITAWLSFFNGQKAVNDLSGQLRIEVTNRIVQHLQNYLEKPHIITRDNINAAQIGKLDLQDKLALERHFALQLKLFSTVSQIYLGRSDGAIVLTSFQDNGTLISKTTEDFPKRSFYRLDDRGNRQRLLQLGPNFDARVRPWYMAAVNAKKPVWSPIYTFAQGEIGLTASEPFYDDAGNLRGVMAVDLVSGRIGDFLRGLQISPKGQTFILERSGFMVASSTSEQPYIISKKDNMAERLQATHSQNDLTRQTVKFLISYFGDLGNIHGAQQLDFLMNSKRQFVQVMPYQDKHGLDWLAVVVVPEDDFMAEIDANTRNTLLLCLVALSVAIATGILTSRWIASPISRLSNASKALAELFQSSHAIGEELDPNVQSIAVNELEVLAQSFNQMANRLRESFLALEEANQQLEQRIELRTQEFKEAAEALHQSNLLLQAQKEAAIDGILAVDKQGRIVSYNQRFCEMWNIPKDVMVRSDENGLLSALLYGPHMPESLVTVVELAYDRPNDYIYDRVYLDDSRVFDFYSSPVLSNRNDFYGMIWYFRDVTARVKAEQELQIEKEKSEHLLLNILPQAIADKLRQNQQPIAEHFDNATILFADIVGFTPISSRMSPTELIELLNQIFSSFDLLVEQYGLEKIKTIGDEYMVAGGLPIPKVDHAEAIAEMALDMQQAISKFRTDKGDPFRLRIGINTGPVVAGVIGIKKFIYDLWGDTVNIASRMESQGMAGCIQVTASTYERLKGKYVFEERGPISVKGKGEMTTYWLKARNPT